MTNWMLLARAEYKRLSTVKSSKGCGSHKKTITLEKPQQWSSISHIVLLTDFNFYFLTVSLISYAHLNSPENYINVLFSVLHLLVNLNEVLLLIFSYHLFLISLTFLKIEIIFVQKRRKLSLYFQLLSHCSYLLYSLVQFELDWIGIQKKPSLSFLFFSKLICYLYLFLV